MRTLLALLLLSLPAAAQHRSVPGVPSSSPIGITAAGVSNGVCVEAGGAATAFVSLTGTWVATVSFVGSNDWTTTTKALPLYSYSSSTGALGAAVTTATANGDFIGRTNGFRWVCAYASAFTSGTISVRLDADPAAAFLTDAGAPGAAPVPSSPPASSTAGTVTCNAGVSPCTVTNTALDVLATNTNRKSCAVCTVGIVDLYCKRATAAGSAATSASFDFILNAGAGALKTGQCWPCTDAGSIWQGPLNCIASAASAVVDVSVSETN